MNGDWFWWGGRRGGGENPIMALVKESRSVSLSDEKYLQLIAPFREACGLPAIDQAALKSELLAAPSEADTSPSR